MSAYITISWEEPDNYVGVPILGYLVSMSENGSPWVLAYDGSVEPNIL